MPDYVIIHWPFGVISTFCVLVGVPANFVSLVYFIAKNKRKSTYVSLLYLFMNSIDLVICLLFLPSAVSKFHSGEALFFASPFLCTAWGYVSQVVFRLSVFCIGILSILRTVCLMCPFIRLSVFHIMVPILVYLVVLLVQQSIPWWYGVGYYYNFFVGGCGWAIHDIFALDTFEYKALNTLLVVIEFIVPLFPIVISCFFSIYRLRTSTSCCSGAQHNKDSAANKLLKQSHKNKRDATITIVILTLIYILFNLPYCTIMVMDSISSLSEGALDLWYLFPERYTPLIYISLTIYSIPLNSTLNPIVYICRIQKLRGYLLDLLCCRRRSLTLDMNSFASFNAGKHSFTPRGNRQRTDNITSRL